MLDKVRSRFQNELNKNLRLRNIKIHIGWFYQTDQAGQTYGIFPSKAYQLKNINQFMRSKNALHDQASPFCFNLRSITECNAADRQQNQSSSGKSIRPSHPGLPVFSDPPYKDNPINFQTKIKFVLIIEPLRRLLGNAISKKLLQYPGCLRAGITNGPGEG